MKRRVSICLAWVVACMGAATLVCTMLWPASAAAGAAAAPGAPARTPPVRVDVSVGGPSRLIPPSFFGISLEIHELWRFENQAALFGRAISLIRPPGDTRMLLRVGGNQADATYWGQADATAPKAVFQPDTTWLQRLAELVRQTDVRLVLGLNLPVHSPSMAADFARAVRQAVHNRLAALEIGNEPNMYAHRPLLKAEHVATSLSLGADWWTHYTPADYWRDFQRYAEALSATVPGIPLAGPALAGSRQSWLRSMPGPRAGGMRLLTFHRYPFTTCWGSDPSAHQFLAGDVSEAAQWNALTTLAHARGQDVRVTEMNSISLCGGDPPAVRTFATALWAADALFEMLDHGIDGVNWHIRSDKPNAPFTLTPSGIEVRPELYGLVTFARTVGSARRLLHLQVHRRRPMNLRAWAVATPTGPRVLLINKGAAAGRVTIHVGRQGSDAGRRRSAQIERLLAESPGAASGVTLGGRAIGADGRWHGAPMAAVAAVRRGAVPVTVPGYSAAIVTLR